MDKKFRSAGEVISRFFEHCEQEQFEQADRFIKSWKTIVGERLASHSKVLDVNRGSIIVEVDHSGWSQQLLLMKKRILKELMQQFPELAIKTLQIRVSSVCTTSYQRQEGRIGAGISRSDEEQEPAVDIDKDLDDPLKDVLTRLRNSIKKGKPC